MRSRAPFLFLSFMFLAACGGQTGEEGASCDPVATTVLAMTDTSALGFSGADVMAVAGGSHRADLTWQVGGQTPLTVSVTGDGTVALVDYAIVGNTGNEAALDCEDQLELGVAVTVATDDGGFDESFTAVLGARLADDARVSQLLDLGAMGGTYAVTSEIDQSRFDEVRAWIDMAFDSGGWRGTVSGQGAGTDPNDPDVAFAESFDIARWNATDD